MKYGWDCIPNINIWCCFFLASFFISSINDFDIFRPGSALIQNFLFLMYFFRYFGNLCHSEPLESVHKYVFGAILELLKPVLFLRWQRIFKSKYNPPLVFSKYIRDYCILCYILDNLCCNLYFCYTKRFFIQFLLRSPIWNFMKNCIN